MLQMINDGITLQKLLHLLCTEAKALKGVNYALATTSSNEINSLTVTNYACMLIVPVGTHIFKPQTTQFSLDVMYMDRLLNDSSNEIDVLSVAIESLKQYVQKLKELDFVVDIPYEIYIQSFTETEAKSDRCAGAILRLNIEVLNNSECYID